MDELLEKLYYKPGSFTNARELYRLAKEEDPKIKYENVKEWLDKQHIHQLTKKDMKKESHGHFYVSKPNNLHQLDILYMPKDKKGYKYILTIINIYSAWLLFNIL